MKFVITNVQWSIDRYGRSVLQGVERAHPDVNLGALGSGLSHAASARPPDPQDVPDMIPAPNARRRPGIRNFEG